MDNSKVLDACKIIVTWQKMCFTMFPVLTTSELLSPFLPTEYLKPFIIDQLQQFGFFLGSLCERQGSFICYTLRLHNTDSLIKDTG